MRGVRLRSPLAARGPALSSSALLTLAPSPRNARLAPPPLPRPLPHPHSQSSPRAMACAAIATSVSAALAPASLVCRHKPLLRQGAAAPLKVASRSRIVMSAAPQSDNKVANLTGLALLAAAVVPEIAEAAQPGVSPSLKNLLLSVVAGGTVLTVIGVAVAGVSTFDPVKRK